MSEITSAELAVATLKKPRSIPGATASTDLKPISAKDAEFLVQSNSYVRRGVEKTSSAIVRNGYVITPSNSGDEEMLKQLSYNSRMTQLIVNMARSTIIHGDSYSELANLTDLGPVVQMLPTSEIDFKRDDNQKIIYKNGIPQAYEQKRNNEVLASWKPEQIAHLRFIEYSGIDLGVSMLQSLVTPCTEYGLVRTNLADSFIRSLNVVHVQAEGATREELEEISADMEKQFSAETAYVTSERMKMNMINANGTPIVPQSYTEPAIAEIAAAFDMPIELIAATSTLDLKDFDKRNAEWLETIKRLQTIISDMFETQVFPAFTDEPVTMEFNSPLSININDLITSIGFAVQSQAMTPEMAQKIINEHPAFKIIQMK